MRFLPALLAVLVLVACGADHIYAPDDVVARSVYVDTKDPPYITLFTVISNENEAGAHSGLLINGSQRVLYDPAGTWLSEQAPERYDMHYGITDDVLRFYVDFHARVSFRVQEQTLYVTKETADRIIALAEIEGASKKGFCADSISHVLRQVPEFANFVRPTLWPLKLSAEFGRLPGVSQTVVYDDDSDDHRAMLLGNATGAEAADAYHPAMAAQTAPKTP
jgi:hypothetical protein